MLLLATYQEFYGWELNPVPAAHEASELATRGLHKINNYITRIAEREQLYDSTVNYQK